MMASLSEIHIPHDMLHRRVVDMVPFCLRDVVEMIATALLGAGMATWAIALTSQSLGG